MDLEPQTHRTDCKVLLRLLTARAVGTRKHCIVQGSTVCSILTQLKGQKTSEIILDKSVIFNVCK